MKQQQSIWKFQCHHWFPMLREVMSETESTNWRLVFLKLVSHSGRLLGKQNVQETLNEQKKINEAYYKAKKSKKSKSSSEHLWNLLLKWVC
jgi:hypothetical protein